jgi:hypothetical protein
VKRSTAYAGLVANHKGVLALYEGWEMVDAPRAHLDIVESILLVPFNGTFVKRLYLRVPAEQSHPVPSYRWGKTMGASPTATAQIEALKSLLDAEINLPGDTHFMVDNIKREVAAQIAYLEQFVQDSGDKANKGAKEGASEEVRNA